CHNAFSEVLLQFFKSSTKYQFQCTHGRKCIERSKVCDGEPQCQDRSDELDCAKRMEGCAHLCDENSRCVPDSFLCDGERDCSDGSDEATCGIALTCYGPPVADVQCSSTEFKCLSGQCVLASMRCDGHPDCWDRSDEDGCTKPPVCTTKHRCPHSKECLVQEWLCDGDQDCKDGSDEKVLVNALSFLTLELHKDSSMMVSFYCRIMDTESPCKKMACSHMCVLAPRRKAVCKCPSGLSLAEDGLLCSSLPKSTFLLLLSPPTVTKVCSSCQL
uniref:Uncharacterized protein n=1 Tax=Xiphophorus couchianus TaxID=32473 RepID=A0A3B5LQS5_9TELE